MSYRETFFDAYVECALWSTTDQSNDQGGEPLDANYSRDDIAPEALVSMREDCTGFIFGAATLLLAASDHHDHDAERAGHDFWLTRNRHGAGFWDRGLGALGNELTKHAVAYGECDLYVGDDGKVYAT